jgi:hypothetical protein
MRPAAVVLAVALAMMGGATACGRCGNTFVAEYLSPDSANELIIYEKGCGPMTGSSTHVDLVPTVPERGKAPEGIGNVLQADASAASLDLKVRWIDAKTVELAYRKIRINLMRPKVDEVDGVEIKHVQHETP